MPYGSISRVDKIILSRTGKVIRNRVMPNVPARAGCPVAQEGKEVIPLKRGNKEGNDEFVGLPKRVTNGSKCLRQICDNIPDKRITPEPGNLT